MSYVYGNILQLIFFLSGIDKPLRIGDNSEDSLYRTIFTKLVLMENILIHVDKICVVFVNSVATLRERYILRCRSHERTAFYFNKLNKNAVRK